MATKNRKSCLVEVGAIIKNRKGETREITKIKGGKVSWSSYRTGSCKVKNFISWAGTCK